MQQLRHTRALSGHTIPRTRGNLGALGTSAQLGQQIPALGHLCALQSCQGLEVSRAALPGPPLAPPPTWDDRPVPRPAEEFPGPSPASAAGKQEGPIAARCRQGAASWQGRGEVCSERRHPSSPEELTAVSRRAGVSLLMEPRGNHLQVAGDGTRSTGSRIRFQASQTPLPHQCLPRARSSPVRHQWLGADALRNGCGGRDGQQAGGANEAICLVTVNLFAVARKDDPFPATGARGQAGTAEGGRERPAQPGLKQQNPQQGNDPLPAA